MLPKLISALPKLTKIVWISWMLCNTGSRKKSARELDQA
jgi:hypothetical protein